MRADDVCFLGIRALGAQYRESQLSPVEATLAAFERIDRHGQRLNAWITLRRDEALAAAAEAERQLKQGRDLGPLHGIPIAIKDNIDTAGIRTTCGSRVTATRVPSADAAVVTRLHQAGAVLLGKTNLLEFAYAVVHPDFGQCNNPWDPKRTSGGSSSGSAAAVSAGMAWAALGTDTGGSIRIPAAYCGIVGLKPTYGLVGRSGVYPLAWSLDHVGPLTRSTDDAQLVLQAIAGSDAADPASARVGFDPGALGSDDLRGVRVGIVPDFLGNDLRPGISSAFERAIGILRETGAAVREVRVPSVDACEEALNVVIAAEAASVHEPTLGARATDYSPMARTQLEIGMMTLAVDYLRAQRLRTMIMKEFANAFETVDVLVSPTVAHVAPADNPHPGMATRGRTRAVRRTGPFNLGGLPAISVPMGTAEDGLPAGLQIAGPWLQDARVLRVAAAFEKQSGWMPVCPPGVR